MRRGAGDPWAAVARAETAGEWLRAAEQAYLHTGAALGQIAADPHDEALYLLLHGLRLPLDAQESVLARRLGAGEREGLERLLRRRLVDRVPAAYLTREAWLGGYRFHVDERVIIPRSYFVEMIPVSTCVLLAAMAGSRQRSSKEGTAASPPGTRDR